jgi:hypothetical protein
MTAVSSFPDVFQSAAGALSGQPQDGLLLSRVTGASGRGGCV